MLTRRLSVLVASMMLGAFAAAGTAWAAAYPLVPNGGSGLQYHIGGGLALPIQPKIPVTVPFPTTMQLLVPPAGGAATPTGIVLQTSGADPKNITIIYPLLRRVAAYKQVGVFKDNPNVFEVATNLSVQFPQTSGTAMFGLGLRTGNTTTTFTTPFAPGNHITYSN